MKTKQTTKPGHGTLARAVKWLVGLAVIAGLLALAFIPKPVEVDTGTIDQGPMVLTIDDDGESRVRERYTISSPLAGQILRIGLDPGDAVKQGDVLAVITPQTPHLLDPRARAQAQARVDAASASVSNAKTQLQARQVQADQLEKSYQRNQILHRNGNVADATFEQIEAAYLAAKHARNAAASAVSIARFDLQQAQAALRHFNPPENEGAHHPDANFTIHSPIDGQVLRVYEKSSRNIQPGTRLLEVGDPNDLELRIDVLSQDAVRIKPGQKVIIRHWGGDTTLHGRVRLVEPSAYTKVSALGVDEQRVDVIADFAEGSEAENPAAFRGLLGDGYRIEAGIVVWESSDSLQVPAGSLFRKGQDWAVYKIDGDRARLSIIKIGHNNGEFAEVLSGLDSGEQVILHPGDRIDDGTLIRPRS